MITEISKQFELHNDIQYHKQIDVKTLSRDNNCIKNHHTKELGYDFIVDLKMMIECEVIEFFCINLSNHTPTHSHHFVKGGYIPPYVEIREKEMYFPYIVRIEGFIAN
jgi:hypothetical protein